MRWGTGASWDGLSRADRLASTSAWKSLNWLATHTQVPARVLGVDRFLGEGVRHHVALSSWVWSAGSVEGLTSPTFWKKSLASFQ